MSHPKLPRQYIDEIKKLKKDNEKLKNRITLLHIGFNALVTLVDLKKYKDKFGKNPIYLERQPQIWEMAKKAIKQIQKGGKP